MSVGPAGDGRPALLETENLRAGFGANTVLHGVSYRVHEGELAAVLGLNGAGKSVSLKVVAGIVPAWAGSVRLHGDDVTKLSAEDRVWRGMGHVPQGRQVFAELSVEQNLRLGGYVLRRRDRSAYPAALDRIMTLFPILGERRTQAAGNLSGGEQAMLAVGRALMSNPSVLLVDEATAGLSPSSIEVLADLLRQVHESGVTILMVEQNVAFALRLADSVHVMQKGRVVYSGAAGELDQDRIAQELGVGQLLGRTVRGAASARVTKKKVAAKKNAKKNAEKKAATPAKKAAKKAKKA